jgi:hypothetical protein
MVRLTPVDDDGIGSAMAVHGSFEEPLCRRQISTLTEKKLDRVADAVDRAVQIRPAAPDLDVGLIHVLISGHGPLAQIEPLKKFRGISDYPTMNRRMVDSDISLGHHLFQIAQTQTIGQIPTNAEQDHRSIKLPALNIWSPPKSIEGHCQMNRN